MFGIDGEALGKIVGGAAAAFAIGLLTWFGNRLNRKDAAERPAPPAAMGFVLDGDTAMAIRDELRTMHADMSKWRAEDREQEKDDKIERLQVQLTQASGITHGNQDDIRADIEELKRMMAEIKLH